MTWRGDQSRDKAGMGDRASPTPGGSTVESCWVVWAWAAVEASLSSRHSGDCPGRVTAVPWQGVFARRSLEQWGCSCHVSGPAGSSCSKPKACQEEAGASPARETLHCTLIPGSRLQMAQRGPGLDSGTKHFRGFPVKCLGSQASAGSQQCLPVNATPLLIQLQSVPTAVSEQWGTRFFQPYFWGLSYTKHSKNQTQRLQPLPSPWSCGGQQQLPAWLPPSTREAT